MIDDSVTQHHPLQSAWNSKETPTIPVSDHPRKGSASHQMTKSEDRGPPAGNGPADRYAAMIKDGSLRVDPTQAEVVESLEGFHQQLLTIDQSRDEGLLASFSIGGWHPWGKVDTPSKNSDLDRQGLYLHGPVGRGKSMLMDLFFETAPVKRKRRVHFHAFMLDVHGRLNDLRKSNGAQAQDDVISRLAADLAKETRLLCFDEFHVQNIADAMILGRLFDHLLNAGIFVVATSNFMPDRLYENGLNRDRFLHFIELLKRKLDIVSLAGPTDYRLERLQNVPVYYCPNGPDTDQALAKVFAQLTDDAAGEVDEITIGSRRLIVPKAAKGVAWFDFAALCEKPLGAKDYLALTEHYHTLIIQDVPKLTRDKHNEARRFMTLVDALYECRVNLIIGADAGAHELYQAGDGAFEFERTASRLSEMQSRDYIETPPSTIAAADFVPFALTTDLI